MASLLRFEACKLSRPIAWIQENYWPLPYMLSTLVHAFDSCDDVFITAVRVQMLKNFRSSRAGAQKIQQLLHSTMTATPAPEWKGSIQHRTRVPLTAVLGRVRGRLLRQLSAAAATRLRSRSSVPPSRGPLPERSPPLVPCDQGRKIANRNRTGSEKTNKRK